MYISALAIFTGQHHCCHALPSQRAALARQILKGRCVSATQGPALQIRNWAQKGNSVTDCIPTVAPLPSRRVTWSTGASCTAKVPASINLIKFVSRHFKRKWQRHHTLSRPDQWLRSSAGRWLAPCSASSFALPSRRQSAAPP